jgi:hypothetical protein
MFNSSKGQDAGDLIKGVFTAIIVVWIIIAIGNQFHWFDWLGPFLKIVWFIIKILLVLAVISVILYIIYYLKNKPEIEKRRKEEQKLERIKAEEFEVLKRKEEAQRLKKLNLEKTIILKKVKKIKSSDLEGLNKSEKEYLIGKWENKILELLENENSDEKIVAYFSGERGKIRKRMTFSSNTNDLFEDVLSSIEVYSTPRLIGSERAFEDCLFEFLRERFSKSHIDFQRRIDKGRVDIVIDDEIALELKIADNKGNLNSLFGQIEWYKDHFDKLAIIILDVGRVPDLDDFIERFESKGARVIVLTDENIRFRRPGK